MEIQLVLEGKTFTANLLQGIDISIPVGPGSVNAFYLDPPSFSPFRAGSFVGSVAEGGPCNCEHVSFYPHGNGTHTECVGHISHERISVNQSLKNYLMPAELISITPLTAENGDHIITAAQIAEKRKSTSTALVIRTWPNTPDKKQMAYSGSNPCYLHHEATAWMRDNGVEHLLLDLPSVDREEDGGALQAHHAFWNYPQNPRLHSTITELIYVPDSCADGLYLLNMQVAPMETDASPSRPVLYALR